MSFSFAPSVEAFITRRINRNDGTPKVHDVSRSAVLVEGLDRYSQLLTTAVPPLSQPEWKYVVAALTEKHTGIAGGIIANLANVLREREHNAARPNPVAEELLEKAVRWTLLQRIAVVDRAEQMIRLGSTDLEQKPAAIKRRKVRRG